MALSDTQTTILTVAARHPDGLAVSPAHLPPAPRAAVARALIGTGLLTAQAAPFDADPGTLWKLEGMITALRITDAGRKAVGEATPALDGSLSAGEVVPAEVASSPPAAAETAGPEGPVGSVRAPRTGTVRAAAKALVASWDADANPNKLAAAIVALRTALGAAGQPKGSDAWSLPRTNTKRAVVLDMLRRSEGASVTQVASATGWATPTVHGFFAGLRKSGIKVEVLERVRQVGPGEKGVAGSYTIYRVADAG